MKTVIIKSHGKTAVTFIQNLKYVKIICTALYFTKNNSFCLDEAHSYFSEDFNVSKIHITPMAIMKTVKIKSQSKTAVTFIQKQKYVQIICTVL
jgi:radical SAM superfamily enzyme